MPADLDGPSSSYDHRTHQREREKVGESGEDTPSRGGWGEAAEETKSSSGEAAPQERLQNGHVTSFRAHSFARGSCLEPSVQSHTAAGRPGGGHRCGRRRRSSRAATGSKRPTAAAALGAAGRSRSSLLIRIPPVRYSSRLPSRRRVEAVRVQSWGRGKNPRAAGRFASQNTRNEHR